jgi:hypothetical protein
MEKQNCASKVGEGSIAFSYRFNLSVGVLSGKKIIR